MRPVCKFQKKTVYEWAKAELLPSIKIVSLIRFKKTGYRKYMQIWVAETADHKQYSETEASKTGDGTEGGFMGKKTRKTAGLRLRGGVYYADTTANGIRISERIGRVSETAAKAILSKFISDAFTGEHFKKAQTYSPTVHDICADYSNKKLAFVKSCETRMYLFKPIDRLLGNVIAKDLRISAVEEYRRIRLSEKKTIGGREVNKNISIRTVNREVDELSNALRWALRDRIIEYNPHSRYRAIKRA